MVGDRDTPHFPDFTPEPDATSDTTFSGTERTGGRFGQDGRGVPGGGQNVWKAKEFRPACSDARDTAKKHRFP